MKTEEDGRSLPTYHSRGMRCRLTRRYGLPNAAPHPGEDVFTTDRVLFVDDDRDGAPIAYWEPDETNRKRRRARRPAILI